MKEAIRFIKALKNDIRFYKSYGLFYTLSLKKLFFSSFLLLAFFSPSLLHAQEMNLPLFSMKGVQIKGFFVDENKGQKVSWETTNLNGNLKTQFVYLENPKVTVYGSSSPIEIQSQKLKIDMVQKDLLFEGNIRMKIQNKILKTNFLKVNTFNQTLTSFDTFTLETLTQGLLTQGQKIKGRALYGSAQEKILRLLNLHNKNFSLSIPLPL